MKTLEKLRRTERDGTDDDISDDHDDANDNKMTTANASTPIVIHVP